jgi:uncharacterized membrane protein
VIATATAGPAAYIALLLAGVLAGSELTSRLIVHPALWRLPYEMQVAAEKLMYRRFASVDPFLMTATVISGFVAAASLHGRASTLALAGAISFASMLALTVVANMPINVAILRWDPANGDPARWRALRRRWDVIHSVRIVLDTAGFALIAAAIVWP